MSLLEETKYLLKQYKILPQKSKGQNFLISNEVCKKIIKSADLKKGDNVLEIGPGVGTLTIALAEQRVNLSVIELDKKFIELLNPLAKAYGFKIIQGNVLKLNLEKILPKSFLKNYKIIANLPYNITSKFLRIFLEQKKYKPRQMVLMLQKEVAERIIAKDGKQSKLSLMCNFYSKPKYLFTVERNNFYPKPKIDSAVVHFKIDPEGRRPSGSILFWQLIRIGFSSKRRTLINNLSAGLKLDKKILKDKFKELGLNENIRAERLEIDDWVRLADDLSVFSEVL